MTRNLALILVCAASAAVTQPTGVPNSSVSGVVKDTGTGKPLANYNVSTYVGATWITTPSSWVGRSRSTRSLMSKGTTN